MSNDFRLSEDFIEQYKNKEVDFGPLGALTHKTKYARPIYEEQRLEEWYETIRRVVEGCYQIQKKHCEQLKLPWSGAKAQKSAQEMYELMFSMKFLPGGRGIKNMGSDFMWNRSSACLYNCVFITTAELSTDFAEPFCFLMNMSMLGCGVGADTKGAGQIKIREPRYGDFIFTVEDSREGWVELIRTVLNTYSGRGSMPKTIDYSKVRPKGSVIKGFGGVASGPDPLKQLVQDIQDILNPHIGNQISSTNITDLFNTVGRCVVSGGLRRTAELVLGDPEDKDFLALKDPVKNKERLNKFGWASNNSIFASVGMDYSEVAKLTVKNGEPGYFWLENARNYGRFKDGLREKPQQIQGLNPCGEIGLASTECCNVSEVFPARHSSYEEFERTLKYVYLYSKSVSLLPTHHERTNAVQLQNRRIGVSLAGVIQSVQKVGWNKFTLWCDKGYQYLKEVDDIYSRWLCIPTSAALTTEKPGGTVPLLCGAWPGIHYPLYEYYFRTMRFAKESPEAKAISQAGYKVENDVVDSSSIVAYFPIHEQDFQRARKDITMWEQLELAAQIQYWWSDNSVSSTIEIRPEEFDELPKALELYQTRLKSVSFLPSRGHQYKQAPYIEITKKEYEQAIKGLKPIDLNDIAVEKYFTHSYCDGESCEISKI